MNRKRNEQGNEVSTNESKATRKVVVCVPRIVHELGDITLEVPATVTDDDIKEWVSDHLDGGFDDESIEWDNNTYEFDINYISEDDPNDTPDLVIVEGNEGLQDSDAAYSDVLGEDCKDVTG